MFKSKKMRDFIKRAGRWKKNYESWSTLYFYKIQSRPYVNGWPDLVHLRWNSWTAFLSRFLGINSSLFRLEFLSGFLPSFFRSTKCSSGIDSSFLFRGIFEKPEKCMVFCKISQQKGLWKIWSKRLESLVKLMSKNSISGNTQTHSSLLLDWRIFGTHTHFSLL